MKKFKHLFILVFSIAIHSSAYCQYFNLEPQGNPQKLIGLKINNPLFKSMDNGYQVSSLSGIYTVYGLFNLKNNWSIYSEIPIIIAKNDYEKENGLGNVLIVLRKALNENRSSQISFGAYLPTFGKEKYLKQEIGILSNIYRLPQFIEGVTVYGNFSHCLPEEKKGLFGFEIGPDIAIPTGEGDVELLLHFGIKGGYRFSKVLLWSEFNSITVITESGLDIDEMIQSQLLFGGQLDLGKIDPGIFYTIPLKEYMREVTSGILGIKVSFEI